MLAALLNTRRLLRELAAAKARIADLESSREAERERNRLRENELLDRVLAAAGRHALTPAPTQPATQARSFDPPMSAVDEARLFALREAATAAGRPASDGDKVFKAQREGRVIPITSPGEPYVLPN